MDLKKTFWGAVLIAGLALSSLTGCGKREEQAPKQPQGIEKKIGENLTNTTAILESHPKFSSDSKEIIYVFNPKNEKSTDIYIMNINGANKRSLTSIVGDNPRIEDIALSPDGKEIAFIASDRHNEEVYIMNADGSNKRKLTDDNASKEKIAFTPRGKEIIYALSGKENSICLMNRDGSNKKEIVSHHLPIIDFSLAGNEYLLAFVDFYSDEVGPLPPRGGGSVYTEKDLYLVYKKDNGWRKELQGKGMFMIEKINPTFVYTSRGAYDLYYIYESGDGSHKREIRRMEDMRAHGVPGYTNEVVTRDKLWAKNLTHSSKEEYPGPPHNLLVYTSLNDQGNQHQIHVIDFLKNQKEKLIDIENGVDDLVISPDGKKIASTALGDIVVIPINGN